MINQQDKVQHSDAPAESSALIGQTNTPDSASFVMRLLLLQLGLLLVEIATSNLGPSDILFGGSSVAHQGQISTPRDFWVF